jgi:hypothetical protein
MLAGVLFDRSESYDNPLLIAIVMSFIALGLLVPISRRSS